jgi:hypothetical protein
MAQSARSTKRCSNRCSQRPGHPLPARYPDHLKDYEVDFVVATEGAGIAWLEIKRGEVWHDGDTWWQTRRGGHEHKIKPVRQAREAGYALREFIENDDRWSQGRLRWDHVIVLPNAEIADDFALPECPQWKVIDRDDLASMASPPRSYIGTELFGNLHSRIGRVGAARVDVDNDVVSVRQGVSAAPAGGGGV